MPVLVCVTGPPGSGKSLLITSLAGALRTLDCRSASITEREGGATVITISTGSRVVLDQPIAGDRVAAVVASIDPGVHVVFAEGYDIEGAPAVVLSERAAPPQAGDPELFAVVDSVALAASFAAAGPGGDAIAALADRIARELLGRDLPRPAVEERAPGGSLRSRLKHLARFGRRWR
jgi:molybdopterin-guanine dinucleotide biosynthesis protein